MTRFAPQSIVQQLSVVAAAFGSIAAFAVNLNPAAGYTGAGVGVGIWLAAGWMWLNEPGNALVVLP